eukprot:CAMPEP_0196764154 /NCGR_PEP_ID=MMETSP1095-20130614/5469_1 /TAXON_ID=96789 ORGANISM="Chromulina nebulosa, Strain UTEXLB2642" /NCGR_SAMPLE_ID=MMETSP1095 /ASSEMBLY_ACC=CAM_ASM_000446 /LENGTH=773 /DNA_ID=CAMNT_0042118947 /DNA_START=66 /DNA_END=2387 /DNA_ORIENTATION=+
MISVLKFIVSSLIILSIDGYIIKSINYPKISLSKLSALDSKTAVTKSFPSPSSLDVYVTGVIDSPVDKVWAVFKPFGYDIKKWWHIYETIQIISPPFQDEVGAIRQFKLGAYVPGKGTVFKEKLVARSDKDYFEEYEYVDSEPKFPGFAANTFVKFHSNSNGTTTVEWGSKSKFTSDEQKQALIATQTSAYTKGIEYLQQYFAVSKPLQIPEFLLEAKKVLTRILLDVATTDDNADWGYAVYPEYPHYPNIPMYELPRLVKGLPKSQAFGPTRIGKAGKRFAEFAFAYIGLEERLNKSNDPFTAFKAFQDGINLPVTPYAIENWNSDTAAALHFIKGLSPLTIKVVKNIESINKNYHSALGVQKLNEYISQKKLLVVDYPELEGLFPYKGMYLYPASALILNKGNGELDLLAIRLSDDLPVYVKDKTPPNRWTLAKFHLKVADNHIMQFAFHLGYSHFALEAFAVATHNAFKGNLKGESDHPLWLLLQPHFRDTIGINYIARNSLISTDLPFTDTTFSSGTPQALEIVIKAWKQWDYVKSSFPNQLLERGFDEAKTDGLEGFSYRDDGFRLWKILGNYVSSYVDAIYVTDDFVSSDNGIKNWIDEITSPFKANVNSFPKEIKTKKALVDVIQNLIWKTSAGHAVLNFAQYQVGSFTPNAPISLLQPVPPGNDEISLEYLVSSLPNLKDPAGLTKAAFQVSFSHFLTEPSDYTLGGPKAISPLAEKYPHIHERFQLELKLLSIDIKARNEKIAKAGGAVYPYLDPEFVPASVDI